jgi:hypothetical protein
MLRCVAVGLLALTAGCRGDLPSELEVPDVSVEVLRADEFGAELNVTEAGMLPQTVSFEGLLDEGFVADSTGESNIAFVPALVLALRVWSAVQTVAICAPPLYADIRRTNNISQHTINVCLDEVAFSVSGGVLARAGNKAIKVTDLRRSIRSMLGGIVTHRRLQALINKRTKGSISQLIVEMRSIFWEEFLRGFTDVYKRHNVR